MSYYYAHSTETPLPDNLRYVSGGDQEVKYILFAPHARNFIPLFYSPSESHPTSFEIAL